MPRGKTNSRPAPAGASPKRQREYEELKEEFEHEGRYPGREKEVAARIVNKQRREFGETKAARKQRKTGATAERTLPVPDYDGKTIPEILDAASNLKTNDIHKLLSYETTHRARKTLLDRLGRLLTWKSAK